MAFKKSNVEKNFPEYYLIKVNQFNDIAKDTLDEWIYFLKNETIEDNFKAKGLKEAKEQLDVLKLSEQARKDYEAHLEDRRYQASMIKSSYGSGHMDGMEQGRKEGRGEGRKALLIEQGVAKFGELPPWAEDKLRNASDDQLLAWSKAILLVNTLEEWLGERPNTSCPLPSSVRSSKNLVIA